MSKWAVYREYWSVSVPFWQKPTSLGTKTIPESYISDFSILSIFGAHSAGIHVCSLRHQASILSVFLKMEGCFFGFGKRFCFHVKELARS